MSFGKDSSEIRPGHGFSEQFSRPFSSGRRSGFRPAPSNPGLRPLWRRGERRRHLKRRRGALQVHWFSPLCFQPRILSVFWKQVRSLQPHNKSPCGYRSTKLRPLWCRHRQDFRAWLESFGLRYPALQKKKQPSLSKREEQCYGSIPGRKDSSF